MAINNSVPGSQNGYVTQTGSETLTNKTLTSPVINDAVIDQADFTQAASATTPASGKSAVYVNSGDSKLHVVDSSGNDVAVGSGSSGRNYLSDYFDSAKDLGTVTNSLGDTLASSDRTANKTAWGSSDTSLLTIARSASSPLRQTYSYLITEAGASFGAFVESPLFSLDAVDLGKPVTVSFDVADNATDGDYQMYICRYDSGDVLQERIVVAGNASSVSPYSAKLPTGTTKFQGFFVAGATATDQYALRIVSNNSSAASIKIDSLYVGPDKVVQGLGGHDWKTPTTEVVLKYGTTTATNITSYNTKYRRVGDSMDIKTYIIFSGAANANGDIGIVLPDGLTIDPSKVDFADRGFQVNATLYNSSKYYTGVSYLDATSNKIGIRQAIGGTTGVTPTIWAGNTTAGSNVPSGAALASGNYIEVVITGIPISNWSSNVTMADRAVERYFYTSESFAATGSTTAEGFAGQVTANNAGVLYDKTITHNMPGAKPFLELSTDGGISWFDADSLAPYGIMSGGVSGTSNIYGCRINSATSTTVSVRFGGYALAANDDSPTYDWGTAFNWRVRMVMPGGVVGFPISSRNIVGDTSGTAVPKSVVGEVITGTNPGGSMTSGVEINASALTLTPGTWRLDGQFYYNATASTISSVRTSIASASATIEYTSIVVSGTAAAGIDTCHQITKYVTVTVDTPYYLVGLCVFAVSTMAIYTDGTWFRATRIA